MKFNKPRFIIGESCLLNSQPRKRTGDGGQEEKAQRWQESPETRCYVLHVLLKESCASGEPCK